MSAARFLQGPPERDDLAQGARYALADRVDQGAHQFPASGPVRFAVGVDHPLVDPPGRLDLDVLVGCEQSTQPATLLVGEQVGAGVQGPPGSVEGVAGAASVAVDGLQDAASALVQRLPGQAHDVKGVHHRDGVGSSSVVAVLNPVNPSMATTSTWSRHAYERELDAVAATPTAGPVKRWDGRPPPKPSTSNYSHFDEPVLHRPLEPATYTAKSFTKLCSRLKIIQSMDRVGSCFDNAAAEAFFSSLEWEVLSRHDFTSTGQAQAVVIDWCYGFYNHQRRHSAAGGQSPINYENTALNREAA